MFVSQYPSSLIARNIFIIDEPPGPIPYINDKATYINGETAYVGDEMTSNHIVDISAEHGNTIMNFSCSSNSELPTNVTWNIETKNYFGAFTNEMVQVSHSKQCQYLTWKRPTLSRDSGVYSCKASNRNGAKTTRLKLTVIGECGHGHSCVCPPPPLPPL